MSSKNIYYKGVYENKPKEIIISQPTTIINLIDSNHYTLNLQSNTNLTLTNPTTSKYIFTINNTSNYQITWDTAIKWEGGFPPTTSNTNDIILIDYDGTDYYGCILDDIRSTLLLNVYPGAAAAYSLRQLRTGVTSVVRVREDFGNTEQDFTAAEITDGTLLSFVGAGNNGYVVTWYDQSSNGNDATQSTAASQPKIVNTGVLVEENGKPAVDFDGTDDYLVSTSAYPTMAYQSTFYVASSTGTNNRVLDTRGTGSGGIVQGWHHKYSNPPTLGDITTIDNGAGTVVILQNLSRTGQNLVASFMYGGSGSSIHEYTNGSLSGSVTSVNNIDFDSGNDLYIGANVNGANNQFFGGKIQDIILYNSDQSSNRASIESSINNYYNIYP